MGSRGWEKKAIQLGKCGQILSTHELIDPQIFWIGPPKIFFE